MISFLYTGEYQLNSKEIESSTTDDKQHQDQDETSSIISESVMDDTTERLLCHVRVNRIADYYNIEALAQLANSKVQTIFEANKDAKVLPPVIQEISTSNRDAQLRSIVASATANRMEELTDLKTFQDVGFEHTLCIETLRACGKRIHLLQHDLNVIESQAVMFESAHEQLTKDMDKWLVAVDTLKM
ncbi:hypothetical protein FPRO04_13653 [Fusarium proliferatum]|nr:hypothetical protein FPRO04_13653 [Fusarium proliferatum]